MLTVLSRHLRRIGIAGFTAWLAACGPAGQVIDTSADSSGTAYQQRCRAWAQVQDSKVDGGAYVEPAIEVIDGPLPRGQILRERDLVDALAKGTLRRTAVYARAGLGKTRLMESLRAQLCDTLPVWTADAKEAAAFRGSGNPLTAVFGKADPQGFAALQRSPAQRLLLVVDALDEVDAAARAPLASALDGLLAAWPQAQLLVLARPAVIEADYGIAGIDSHLHMRPLDCATVDRWFAQQVSQPDQRNALLSLLTKYGLLRSDAGSARCQYSGVATWSDAQTLLAFFQQAAAPGSNVMIHRSNVHQALVGARLKKELDSLQWTPDRALSLVDALTNQAIRSGQLGVLRFDLATCTAAVDRLGLDTSRSAAQVCERVWQSPLFVTDSSGRRFAFADPGVQDLFVARWIDQQLDPQQPDCKAAVGQNAWLKEGDVFTFLIGQPRGGQCIMPLLDDRCSRDPKSDQVGALDDGLAIGRARQRILLDMQAGYEATYWKYCTRQTLRSFEQTVTTR